jgi:RHS repeat-associated protein
LGEIRDARSGFQQSGTVAYTHGGGLDAPLSLVRKGLNNGPATIVPHSNWRGQYHAGSYTDGAVAGNSRLDLREVRWPAENAGAYLNPLRPFRRDAPWMGSLVQSSEDASGLMYRRNRYYDPKTGRFTQEDPIGLAGGLNTYGFAGGDPVSYEDPYGLYAGDCCNRLGWEGDPKNVERAVEYAQNASRGERVLAAGLMGFTVGFLLPPVGTGVLGTLFKAAPVVGGAGAVGSRTAARMARPPVPNGMTNTQFGQLLGWGRGSEAARGQIGKLSASTLREAGVDRSMAQAWQRFYEYEAQAVRTNPSAPGRADLMRHVANLLKD